MRGGPDARHGELDPEDVERATKVPDGGASRAWARDRFPVVDGAPDLVDELLDMHTPRQLLALTAIMERIEADLRAAPVLAALRLAVLHALLPSSRLATGAGRGGALRGRRRPSALPAATQWRGGIRGWRSRTAWAVRGFVQRLEGRRWGRQARLGEDQALAEGSATAVLAERPASCRALSDGAGFGRGGGSNPKVRLVLGQPPMRSLDRLAVAYHGPRGPSAARPPSLPPIDALADQSLRAPWSWQAVTVGRSLAAVEPSMARDGRSSSWSMAGRRRWPRSRRCSVGRLPGRGRPPVRSRRGAGVIELHPGRGHARPRTAGP